MAPLRKESKSYEKISDMYDNKKGDLTLEFFEECVNVACESTPREIRFVLFKLKFLNEEVDTGNEVIDTLTNTTKKIFFALTEKKLKSAFIIAVFETALEEVK